MKNLFLIILSSILMYSCSKDSVYIYDFIVANESSNTILVKYQWRGEEVMDTIKPFNQIGVSNARHTVNSDILLTESEIQNNYICHAWSSDSVYQEDLTDLTKYIYSTSMEQMGVFQKLTQCKYVYVIK